MAGPVAAKGRTPTGAAEHGVQEVSGGVAVAALPDPPQWQATDLPGVAVQRVGAGVVAQCGGAAPVAPDLKPVS